MWPAISAQIELMEILHLSCEYGLEEQQEAGEPGRAWLAEEEAVVGVQSSQPEGQVSP